MPPRILSDLIEAGLPGGRGLLPDPAAGTLREWTSAEIRLRSHRLAAALESYGLLPGTPAAVVAAPSVQSTVALFALWSTGAAVLPLDPVQSDPSILEAMARGAIRFVFVENQAVLDRVLRIRPDLESLEMVLLLEAPEGERPSPALLANSAEAVGATILAEDPERVDRILRRIEADETATIGAASRSHREMLRSGEALRAKTGIEGTDVVLTGFPSGHLEYVPALAASLAVGAAVALGGSGSFPDTLHGEVGLVRPTMILARVEAVDSLCRRYLADAAKRGLLARRIHAWALSKGKDGSRGWKRGLAERLALRTARAWFGGRLRRVMVTGGVPAAGTQDLLVSLGIDLRGLDSAPSP